jgi:hypothetical protein
MRKINLIDAQNGFDRLMALLNQPSPAPDICAAIRAAQDKLRRAVQAANLQGDPLGSVIDAYIDRLTAQHGMIVGAHQKLAAQISDAKPLPSTISDAELRQMEQGLAQGATKELHKIARGLVARNVLLVAGILITVLVVGAGVGYWFGASTEAARYVQTPANLGVALTGPDAAEWANLIRLNNIGMSVHTCVQQAGGEACSITLWSKPARAGG